MDSMDPKTQEALDYEYTHREGRSNPNNLRDQVSVQQGERSWPTPDSNSSSYSGEGYGLNLREKAANWPTPTSTQHKGWAAGHNRANTNDRLDYQAERLAAQSGPPAHQTQTDGNESSESDQTSPRPSTKRLNPSFVEWMMGVPIGWVSLKPLGMGSFRQWLQNFSEVYEAYGELGEV
jgi:hypothetical protein